MGLSVENFCWMGPTGLSALAMARPADAGYGDQPLSLEELEARGLLYVVGVASFTRFRPALVMLAVFLPYSASKRRLGQCPAAGDRLHGWPRATTIDHAGSGSSHQGAGKAWLP